MSAQWIVIAGLITGIALVALMFPKRAWFQTFAIVALAVGMSGVLVFAVVLGPRLVVAMLEHNGLAWTNPLADALIPLIDFLRIFCLVLTLWVWLLAGFALRGRR